MQMQTAAVAAESHPFMDALFAGDFVAMGEAVTPDVVLNSPILTAPFEGREAVMELFEVVLDTLEDIEYTSDLADGDTRIMVFRSRIAGKVEAESIDIMRLAEDGRIREFTIMFRPLVATTTLASELGKRLGARRARWRGWVAGAASRPVVWLARISDRVAPRLVK